MEQYERWEEAEQFFLPEFEEELEPMDEADPSLSAPESQEKNGTSGPDDLSQMLLSKLNFKRETEAASIQSAGSRSGPGSRTSSRSSRTSPECAQHENGTSKSDKLKAGHQRTASGSTIPVAPATLRPLLSALLWRLHSGPDADNSAKGCILVTNDRATQVWAQKFGIGVKNILQLRTAIQYEEREYKNRCKYVEKTQTQSQHSGPKTLLSYEEDSDEDELVFVPRGGRGKGTPRGTRAGSSRKAAPKSTPKPAPKPAPKSVPATTETPIPTQTQTQNPIEVPTQPIDPNSFSRSLGPNKTPTLDLSTQQGAARNISGASRRAPNGRRGGSGRGTARGNGRGRGKLWVP